MSASVSQGDSGHETLLSDEDSSPTPANKNKGSAVAAKTGVVVMANATSTSAATTERASSEVLYSSISNG